MEFAEHQEKGLEGWKLHSALRSRQGSGKIEGQKVSQTSFEACCRAVHCEKI